MAPIFEAKTSQTHSIKSIIDTIYSLLKDDYKIIITPPEYTDENTEDGSPVKKKGGISIREVNHSSTFFIQCKLEASEFEHYYYKHHKDILVLGINAGNLLKCMKCMSNFDTLTWRIDEDDLNKLEMILENNKEKKIFRINLMELNYKELKIDKIEPQYLITLPSQDLQRYCKDMKQQSNIIDIKCTGSNLVLTGNGEIGEFEYILNENDDGLHIHLIDNDNKNEKVKPIVTGLYELEFITIFTKCTNLSEYISIYLRNNYPIIIEYPIQSTVSENIFGVFKFVLSQNTPDELY